MVIFGKIWLSSKLIIHCFLTRFGTYWSREKSFVVTLVLSRDPRSPGPRRIYEDSIFDATRATTVWQATSFRRIVGHTIVTCSMSPRCSSLSWIWLRERERERERTKRDTRHHEWFLIRKRREVEKRKKSLWLSCNTSFVKGADENTLERELSGGKRGANKSESSTSNVVDQLTCSVAPSAPSAL